MHMNQVGLELARPQRKRRRDRTGKQLSQARHARHRNPSAFMFRAPPRVRHHHLELHLVRQALAYFLEDRFHSSNVRIVKFSQLENSHAVTSRAALALLSLFAPAIVLARTRSNFSASSLAIKLPRIHS